MVRTYKRKTDRGGYGEQKLKEALKAVKDGTPLIRASKVFEVPARTLRRHRDKLVQEPGAVQLGRYRTALHVHVEQKLKAHVVKRMVERLMSGAPPQSVGYASASGWSDQDIFLKWLEHFNNFANPSRDNPHIVIPDGHPSHKTLAAVEFCRAHGIHLLTLPPNSTHKMQPLDRTYFKSLKAAFNCASDNFMVTNPGRRITIHDIATLSGAAYLITALPEKAINGFKHCGLWPYDPEVYTEFDFQAVLQAQRPSADEYNHSNGAIQSPAYPITETGNASLKANDSSNGKLYINCLFASYHRCQQHVTADRSAACEGDHY